MEDLRMQGSGRLSAKKVAIAGMLAALAVACSGLYIPVGASKCFPVQHAVDLIAAVLLGPWYAVGVAFTASLSRFLLGTGTLLAFPGSMIGALVSGLLFARTQKLWAAFAGEIFGTGVLGALVSYPVAAFIMSQKAALFGFVVPFAISSLGGAIIAIVLLLALRRRRVTAFR